MKRSGKVLGGILIILGVLFLLDNLNIIDPIAGYFNIGFIIGKFWATLFLIIPGLMFHLGFFSGNRRNPGLLVPGGILLVLGVVFQINMLFGGWSILWPLYIFSVAFGLFELYVFGSRDKGLLIPVGILSGISAIFFFSFSLSSLLSFSTRSFVLPIIMIGAGLAVLFRGRGKNTGQRY
jgi:hypothetical protein